MRFKGPRWLWIAEGMLLTAALALIAYKAAMWVRPIGTVRIGTASRTLSPHEQAMENFRLHPEGFIRITKESWSYDPGGRIATHFFTLESRATVTYEAIEIRLEYSSDDGRVLLVRTLDSPGTLAPGGSIRVSGAKVAGVPAEAARVTAAVVSALVR